jgi:hypothetical protein
LPALLVFLSILKLSRKLNSHPSHLDDWKSLKDIPATTPKVKLLDIYFPLGLHVTARAGASSTTGVSVYDVLVAIHKQFKKKVFPPQLIFSDRELGLLI